MECMSKSKELESLQLYHKSKFDLYIQKSQIPFAGYGVFTRSFIPKNSYIDDYYGEIIDYMCGGEYSFFIDNGIIVDAKNPPRCFMAMINDASFRPKSKRALKKFYSHNFSNNCHFETDEINKRVMVYSKEDIQSNSELFVWYGSDYWTNL